MTRRLERTQWRAGLIPDAHLFTEIGLISSYFACFGYFFDLFRKIPKRILVLSILFLILFLNLFYLSAAAGPFMYVLKGIQWPGLVCFAMFVWTFSASMVLLERQTFFKALAYSLSIVSLNILPLIVYLLIWTPGQMYLSISGSLPSFLDFLTNWDLLYCTLFSISLAGLIFAYSRRIHK